MKDERGSLYLITGLIIGVLAGLLYAWLVRPVQYTNTTPASLRAEFKDAYRALIAAAYASNGDLVRAKARLELLQDDDLYQALAEQAQRTLADGNNSRDAQALGLLAVALGQPPATVLLDTPHDSPTPLIRRTPSFTPTSPISITLTFSTSTGKTTVTPTFTTTASLLPESTQTPSPTATRTATITPLPTRTPTPTPGLPFILLSEAPICRPELTKPLIQVNVFNAAGTGIPGSEVIVSWNEGEDHFFTGLKPELGTGYADFVMEPGENYTVHLAAGGKPVEGLTSQECSKKDGERYWGSWLLEFAQP